MKGRQALTNFCFAFAVEPQMPSAPNLTQPDATLEPNGNLQPHVLPLPEHLAALDYPLSGEVALS